MPSCPNAMPARPAGNRRGKRCNMGWNLAAWLSVLVLPLVAAADDAGWSVGAYVGKYYDTEPAGILHGDAGFLDQYLVALTASKTVWQAQTAPFSLEIDAMVGLHSGVADLQEVAVAPALRWSGFPWRSVVQTDLRIAPLGISYTSSVSPLERGTDGRGSQWLNWLFIEAAFSQPRQKSDEYFIRLHHRCTVYDLINDYGANGEDFLAFGFRRKF
jgi:hypothetical protein